MNDWIGVATVVAAIVGSNVWLHRDIASLRERMAKLEGRVDTLITAFIPRKTPQDS